MKGPLVSYDALVRVYGKLTRCPLGNGSYWRDL